MHWAGWEGAGGEINKVSIALSTPGTGGGRQRRARWPGPARPPPPPVPERRGAPSPCPGAAGAPRSSFTCLLAARAGTSRDAGPGTALMLPWPQAGRLSEAHPAFGGGWWEPAVPAAPAPEPIFLPVRLWLGKGLPILPNSAPRLGARTRSRHGLEAANDSANASEGGRLQNGEGSKKNKI